VITSDQVDWALEADQRHLDESFLLTPLRRKIATPSAPTTNDFDACALRVVGDWD